jgi:glycosyltransferase involved in cell wall biosynthesis
MGFDVKRLIFDVSMLSVVDKAVTGISRVMFSLIKYIQLIEPEVVILAVDFNRCQDLLSMRDLASRINKYVDIKVTDNPGDIDISKDDIILLLGEQWLYDDVMERVELIKTASGCQVVSMIHDLSPMIYPETFEKGFPKAFKKCIDKQAYLSDVLVMYSDSTISDFKKFYPEITNEKIKKIKIGDVVDSHGSLPPIRDPDFDYILFVSTLQPRKNHAILLWVWRKLIDNYGDACPVLMLVGKQGYGVEDFLFAINNNPALKSKIILKGQVTDAELNILYRNCMFTIYPSLYEGWGLPIAESLSRGRFCLVANNSSMVEIAGSMVEYIDPLDSGDIYRKISKLIDDPSLLVEKEKYIVNNYKPTQWSETASTFLKVLNFL